MSSTSNKDLKDDVDENDDPEMVSIYNNYRKHLREQELEKRKVLFLAKMKQNRKTPLITITEKNCPKKPEKPPQQKN